MNFWIAPPANPLQDYRLRFHFNTRGIATYLGTGQHPLAFSFRMELPRVVSFYTVGPRPLGLETTRELLFLASEFWCNDLADLDLLTVALRVANINEADETLMLELVRYHLYRQKENLRMKASDSVPPDVMARLESSLASLEQALIDKDPMMPQHLRNTHSLLISYPETVHLLEDIEIAKLIDAAEIHTKTEIVKAAVRGKGGSGSRKKIDVGDL